MYLSFKRLRGYFEPGGKRDFCSFGLGSGGVFELEGLDEFPAFPDLTIPRFGGITVVKLDWKHRE